MVLSINVALKASDEQIVKFLLSLVFGSTKKRNSRECLRHDILGATKLIEYILEKDKKNPKSWVMVSTLVYGNTIVLGAQVAKLLLDALSAKDRLSISKMMLLEEERKRKTRQQMQIDDEYTAPKKKRKSKEMADDFIPPSPVPISQALRQNITMPDVFSIARDEIIYPDDDLVPFDGEQLQMLYGFMDENVETTDNVLFDQTFIDRCSSSSTRRRDIQDVAMDEEYGAPLSQELPTEEPQIPPKSIENAEFEPASTLKDMLLFRRLPLAELEERKSLEDEMEDVRNHGIQNSDVDMPVVDDVMVVPRISSLRLELDEIDENTVMPSPFPPMNRNPRGPVPTPQSDDPSRLMITYKEMHKLMEDYSSLVESSAESRMYKPPPKTDLKYLMSTVPFYMREKVNPEVLTSFPSWKKKIGSYLEYPTMHPMDSEDEEDERPSKKRSRVEVEELEPLNLSSLKVMAAPLKSPTVNAPPEEVEFEMREEPREAPRDVPEETQPITPIRSQEHIEEMNFDVPSFPQKNFEWNPQEINETSTDGIRQKILDECHSASPFALKFESVLSVNATRREAARAFYVTLELLKERHLVAQQEKPFDVINLQLSGKDSDDVDELIQED